MSNDHAHPSSKQYFTTWGWLLCMTLLALGIGYVPNMPEALKALLLVSITLAKIALIGRIFMHLKFEKMNLVMLTFSPLVLSMILFFMTRGETRMQDASHEIISHQGFVMPHPAEGHEVDAGGHGK